MPFRSKAQRNFMFAKHPKIASNWMSKYGSGGKNLPAHIVSKAIDNEKGQHNGHGK